MEGHITTGHRAGGASAGPLRLHGQRRRRVSGSMLVFPASRDPDEQDHDGNRCRKTYQEVSESVAV